MKQNTSKLNEDFIKHCDENSNKEYILEVDTEYLKDLHDDLPFLPERMKIKIFSKLVCNVYGKKD